MIEMKEAPVYRSMKKTGQKIITHDDRLILRAQKADIKLNAKWKASVNKVYKNGMLFIIGYMTDNLEDGKKKPKRISIEEFKNLSTKKQERCGPIIPRYKNLGDRVIAYFQDSYMDLRLLNLFDNLGSRYRTAIKNY